MRGAKIQYKKLGAVLRKAREGRGLSVAQAAQILGLTNLSYLASCERGNANFPLRYLRRAIELYGVAPIDIIKATADDYKAGMRAALGIE